MPETHALTADAFREETLAVVDRLTERCSALDLGEPPEALAVLRRKLADGEHRVLVCGEAKRGKSCLVNAMIGEDLLPRDLDVATCQPFAVRRRERRGFRLRFEDGSSREIGADELAAYGSQVLADRGEAATVEAPLRWIEVDVAARFLPDRVAVIDLPGLGTLHAAHAEVTRRFVPLADAVIFVLDSGQPLGRREIEHLEALLEVTSRIFCVQTKIDQHDRESWEQTLRRNEAILAERLGDRLPDARVWPVSSTNLLAAATAADQGADALLFVSRYRELADALQGFLAEVGSAPRAVAALVLAARHHQASQAVLSARLQSLTERSAQEAAAYRAVVAERHAAFQQAWGASGHERTALLKGVRRIAALGKQQLRESLGHAGSIALEMERRIDRVESVEAANALGETLAGDVVAAAMDEWRRVCDLTTAQYARLLEPLLEASQALLAELDAPEVGVPEHEARVARSDDNLYDRIRGTWGYSMPMYVGAGLAISIVGTPIAMAAAAGGVLWAVTRGWKQTATQRTRTAKSELHRQLRSALQAVGHHFLAVDLSSGRYSRADEYFGAMETAMVDHVDAFVARRLDELRRELARLEAQEQLQAREREATVRSLRTAVAEWEAMARRLGRLLGDEVCRPHIAALTAAAAGSRASATPVPVEAPA
jgi:GTPase SAR1 family protein